MSRDKVLDGVYYIINKASGTMIDLPSVQDGCSSRCLKAKSNAGGFVVGWSIGLDVPRLFDHQQWLIKYDPETGGFGIQNIGKGKLLELPPGANGNGAQVTCTRSLVGSTLGRACQVWNLVEQDPGWYTIQNIMSATSLEVANGSSANRTAIKGCSLSPAKEEQLWRLERRSRTSTEIFNILCNTPPFHPNGLGIQTQGINANTEYITLLDGFRTRIFLESGVLGKGLAPRGPFQLLDFVKKTQEAVRTAGGERLQVPGVAVLIGIVEGETMGEKRAYNWYLTQDLCTVAFLEPRTGREYTARGLDLEGFRPTSAATLAAPHSTPVETAHEDMIHDAQLDYYGKRLATCSSDRTIKIFDVIDGEKKGAGVTLRGHSGPVWQVAWGHPKYGNILASCSYDGKVFIWKEQAPPSGPASGNWTKIKEYAAHSASVNSVSWAPHELGAIVACGSSDGKISVLTFENDGKWNVEQFDGHVGGCTAVSWAPATLPGSLINPSAAATPNPSSAPTAAQQQPPSPPSVKRFVSAGCDNKVKIWVHKPSSSSGSSAWQLEETLDGHSDWVRDVAWAPNIGLPRSYIATASQDKTVCVWTKDSPGAPWVKTTLEGGSGDGNKFFPDVVWRASWSLAGNILAVSCGDGKVTLWKENLKGGWECVSEMTS
ncbi:GTPase-activating protein S13 [Tulasnella sp. 427]|nr:GTPase-activating protein S13 [Tulasnella sp. 427]